MGFRPQLTNIWLLNVGERKTWISSFADFSVNSAGLLLTQGVFTELEKALETGKCGFGVIILETGKSREPEGGWGPILVRH